MRRLSMLVWTVALVGAACGSGDDGGTPDGETTPPRILVVQAANYELLAGRDQRFILGLLTVDNLFVTAGTVDMEFSYLGDGSGPAEEAGQAVGEFLAIPGEEPGHQDVHAGAAEEGRGVYRVDPMVFDRPGIWQVEVSAAVDQGPLHTGTATFEVVEEPSYPAPGERAPRTENLTVDSEDAPPEAIDSRAADGAPIPDPELHRETIAEAVRAGRPALVIFSTPVFCISQFCGPVTDMVAELASEYRDRAAFIHVEIWRDHQNNVVNEGAAEWVLRNEDLTEPWVFLIGSDGRIAERWDNVATRQEIEPLLRALPPA